MASNLVVWTNQEKFPILWKGYILCLLVSPKWLHHLVKSSRVEALEISMFLLIVSKWNLVSIGIYGLCLNLCDISLLNQCRICLGHAKVVLAIFQRTF